MISIFIETGLPRFFFIMNEHPKILPRHPRFGWVLADPYRLRISATKIQAVWRGHTSRLHQMKRLLLNFGFYGLAKKGGLVIHGVEPALRACDKYGSERVNQTRRMCNVAATKIQAVWRGRQSDVRALLRWLDAPTITGAIAPLRAAARRIQAAWRHHRFCLDQLLLDDDAMISFIYSQQIKAREVESAARIQAVWRGRQYRLGQEKMRELYYRLYSTTTSQEKQHVIKTYFDTGKYVFRNGWPCLRNSTSEEARTASRAVARRKCCEADISVSKAEIAAMRKRNEEMEKEIAALKHAAKAKQRYIAAIIVQTRWRNHYTKCMVQMGDVVQKELHGADTATHLIEMFNAAVLLQARWRGNLLRHFMDRPTRDHRRTRPFLKDRPAASVVVSGLSFYAGNHFAHNTGTRILYNARKRLRKREGKANKIQAVWRGWLQRNRCMPPQPPPLREDQIVWVM